MEFSSLIVKKFAKLFARNERLRNKKSSEQLYIKQIQNFEFQTGTIYICTIELISKNFNFKKINTMNNRQEIERVSRSCRFYF